MGGKMRSLAIVLLSAVALSRANPCQNDQDVYFPDREDCGRFYMCRNGEVVGHMNCPDGLLWNTDLLTCDWPRNVECFCGAEGHTDECAGLVATLAEPAMQVLSAVLMETTPELCQDIVGVC